MRMYIVNFTIYLLLVVNVPLTVSLRTRRKQFYSTTSLPRYSHRIYYPITEEQAHLQGTRSQMDKVVARRRAKRLKNQKRQETEQECEEKDGEEVGKKSFLWTIQDRKAPVYFYGTIHVPYTQVWKHISKNVKQSFQRADQVHFELDLMDSSTVSSLAKCQLLPQGEYLSNVIPSELYTRLKRHLENVKEMMPGWMTAEQQGRGLYADYLFNAITGNWERKRPIWIMLMVNSLTESDIKTRGVPVLDLYLAKEARRQGKVTGGVEQVSDQCIPLNQLNFTQVLFALNQTLRQREVRESGAPPYTTDDLIQHYNCGQLDNVLISHDTAQVPNLVFNVNTSLSSDDLVIAREIDQYFQQELIYKRNHRMANRIIRLLRNHPNDSFFFAFGAGHLIGNNTVINILQKKGYNIQNTPQNQPAYLGEDYKAEQSVGFLADIDSSFPLPRVLINGSEFSNSFTEKKHKHRHRHQRKKQRKGDSTRERVHSELISEEVLEHDISLDNLGDKVEYPSQPLPQFKDLWVRLDTTSADEKLPRNEGTAKPVVLLTQADAVKNCCHLMSSNTQTVIVCVLFTLLLLLNSNNAITRT